MVKERNVQIVMKERYTQIVMKEREIHTNSGERESGSHGLILVGFPLDSEIIPSKAILVYSVFISLFCSITVTL